MAEGGDEGMMLYSRKKNDNIEDVFNRRKDGPEGEHEK